jgi:ATP-dependent Clp protease ATP-binding subunit ClpA
MLLSATESRRRPRPAWALLHPHLTARIRGQPEVLTRLAAAVLRSELAAVPRRGSRGCFFFAGPTGVGKTATALALADFAFGPHRLVRFDCSEFKTLDSVTSLLGDRGQDCGRFGQAYARVPKGIWLFDEIEKAHPEFVHLFLQMTDAGRLTLANGETLDLGELYLIVTSNLGSTEILGREHLPFTSLERHVVRSIQRHLRPELLGRFGAPFVFRPLARAVQAEIAQFHLRALLDWQEQQHGRRIVADDAIVRFLLQVGFSPRLGARPLLDTLREQVGNAIVASLLAGGNGSGRLAVAGNGLQLLP